VPHSTKIELQAGPQEVSHSDRHREIAFRNQFTCQPRGCQTLSSAPTEY